MKKNIFGTELFEKFDKFVMTNKLIKEQKSIEKRLNLLNESEDVVSTNAPYSYNDIDGDKVYQIPLDINGEHEIYKLYKEDENFSNLVDNFLSHGEGVEFEDGTIFWASDLFDSIKYYEKLGNFDDTDDEEFEFEVEIDEVSAILDKDCDGQKEPLFTAKGSSIMEENSMYDYKKLNGIITYLIPFTADSIEKIIDISEENTRLNSFLRGKLKSEDEIKTDDDYVFKGSDIFDYILNYSEPVYELDETLDNIKKEWEGDNNYDSINTEDDDENNNFGEPLPKKQTNTDTKWSTGDMVDEIANELSKKMNSAEAIEICETIDELISKQKSLKESFSRMNYLVNLEKYR